MVKLPNASDEDLRDIIAFLRSDDPLVKAQDVDNHDSRPSFLTKALCRVAFKPFPYPTQQKPAPPPGDAVAFGRYLVNVRLLCFSCHSADFKTNDELHPERSAGYLGGGNAMPDIGGKLVHTSNLTPDAETGIGRWSVEDFRRALKDGIRPDNRPAALPDGALPSARRRGSRRDPRVPAHGAGDPQPGEAPRDVRRRPASAASRSTTRTAATAATATAASASTTCARDRRNTRPTTSSSPGSGTPSGCGPASRCPPGTASSRRTSTRRSSPTCGRWLQRRKLHNAGIQDSVPPDP